MVSLQPQTSTTIPVEGLNTRDELTEEWGEPTKDFVTIPLQDDDPNMLSILVRSWDLNLITYRIYEKEYWYFCLVPYRYAWDQSKGYDAPSGSGFSPLTS